MKKLFASLLAATMVAGMAVSAFAYTNNGVADGTFDNAVTANRTNDDYTLADFICDKDGNHEDTEINGGKLYFPILVADEIFDEENATDANSTNDKYLYATKASEVEDLRAKVKATIGGQYVEKEANIVRKLINIDNADTVSETAKIYCVEVKVADFADVSEKEIEFDVTLYNKNRKQIELEDVNFTLGSDAVSVDAVTAIGNGSEDEFSKAYKMRNNELTLYIKEGAKAYELDEADGEDVELIYLDIVDADATFEVGASDQGDLYLGYSTDANKAVVIANPDAEINFLDFDANPEFDFTGTLKLTVEDPDKTYFCYELVDGKLSPVGKYNAEDETFDIRTRELTSYVLADKELVDAETEDTTEEKPEEKPVDPSTPDKEVPTGAIA